jgi:acetyl esterase/lipase
MKRYSLAVCLFFASLFVPAYPSLTRAADEVSATSPAASSGQSVVKLLANERFCSHQGKAGLCDVYAPASKPPQGGHPVVIVVHGGGWISGDKWTLEGHSRSLARNGIVAVTINYRLAPKHKFPTQLDDVRTALLWTKENAKRFSINLNRLGVFGYSAGGHLSTLVAALADEPLAVRSAASEWSESDARWQQLPKIRAVCAGGPPCDFRSLPIDSATLAFFLGGSRREKSAVYAAASPAAHISSSDPVTQIIHGDSDFLVPISGSRKFHQAQLAAGIDSRLEVLPNQGHMVTFLHPRTNATMLEFFREMLIERNNSNKKGANSIQTTKKSKIATP